MKATGIVRRIDELGRVVIPKEIRRTLRIRESDPLEIFTDREGQIILKKYSPLGELGNLAQIYAESLAQTTGVGAFITDTEQEKMEVIHSMRMAYKIRSEFVHGSVSSLVGSNAQAELGKLSSEVDSYVRRALRKAFFDETINYEETTEDKKRVREYLRNNWPC